MLTRLDQEKLERAKQAEIERQERIAEREREWERQQEEDREREANEMTCDIGHWGQHTSSRGIDILQGQAWTTEDTIICTI